MAHHNQLVSSSSSSLCYSDVSSSNPAINPTHLASHHHLHSFDPNPEIYNLATGIEMIGFHPSKPTSSSNPHHHHDPDLWKGFSGKPGNDPGPSKGPGFYNHHHHDTHGHDGGGSGGGLEVGIVFPCEGNERPSQGLSLSLSSNNPSTIGLQSFELRHHNQHQGHDHDHNNQRLFVGKTSTFMPTSHHQQEEVFLGKSVSDGTNNTTSSSMSMQFEMMRNSKYLGPAQELLNEFCNLGTKQISDQVGRKKKKKINKDGNLDGLDGGDENVDDDSNDQNNENHNNNASSSTIRNNVVDHSQSLYGLNLLELQKRKTKLLAMLEELDRRYKRYCEQMKAVVSSFESVAGSGAANVYSALASKAMSRHFRCLRDAIVAQIKATKKAMGDKDASTTVPGTTRGETPRLRVLDQALRQQRAFQQMTMMESHPWRPQRGLPERSVSVLRAWLFEHFLHPYPSDVDKHILARQTGLSRSQVSNWFINARVRLWKPMVEEMYKEETKEEQDNNVGSSSDTADHQPTQPTSDQKPTPDQLVRIDPECLSSIVNTTTSNTGTLDRNDAQNRMNLATTTNKSPHNNLQQSQFGRVEAFGSMDNLDFPSSSSYNHHQHSGFGTQNDHNTHQGFGGSGGSNVSLTLGLQQHVGNGVSLGFSPATQSSLFYGRDHIDDCQPVQYSLLDGDQGQNLPYRNLMGAQLLHDFA